MSMLSNVAGMLGVGGDNDKKPLGPPPVPPPVPEAVPEVARLEARIAECETRGRAAAARAEDLERQAERPLRMVGVHQILEAAEMPESVSGVLDRRELIRKAAEAELEARQMESVAAEGRRRIEAITGAAAAREMAPLSAWQHKAAVLQAKLLCEAARIRRAEVRAVDAAVDGGWNPPEQLTSALLGWPGESGPLETHLDDLAARGIIAGDEAWIDGTGFSKRDRAEADRRRSRLAAVRS